LMLIIRHRSHLGKHNCPPPHLHCLESMLRSKEIRKYYGSSRQCRSSTPLSWSHYRSNVSQHTDFEQADLNQDPNVLWTIIRETHLTAIHGVGLGALELVQMKNKFAQLRQKPGVSICEFKKKFALQYEGLSSTSHCAARAGDAVFRQAGSAALRW
jgi:hypothetical protein